MAKFPETYLIPYTYQIRYTLDDQFTNITSIVHKFLDAEKHLNKKLLELHECAGDNRKEEQCTKPISKRKYYKKSLFTPVNDPLVSVHFSEFCLMFISQPYNLIYIF